MKKFEELTKPQQCATWALAGALLANLAADIWAYYHVRRADRNWNRAMAEDIDKAKANVDSAGE
jgi:hypothetical protein